jgi:ribosome-binding factor A
MGLRQEKFERLMQRDLGEIIQRRSADWFGGAFITVSDTSVSPDLGYLKVYVSLFNAEDKDELMERIESHKWEIRKMLASKIRNEVRKVPELEFFEDNSLDEMNKMDALFDKIKKDNPNEEDEGE